MIADTHFGSDRLRRYENRPFDTAEEMDRELIRRWNETVDEGDLVYHLGDFGAEGHEADVLAQLNGKVVLIKGNHETESNQYYRGAGFAEVYDMPVLYEGFWLLSHEPLYVNENMPYANLFGHVHANPLYRNYSRQHLCCSVERIDYRPIDFEEVRRLVTGE